jgi:hypothetical protein
MPYPQPTFRGGEMGILGRVQSLPVPERGDATVHTR